MNRQMHRYRDTVFPPSPKDSEEMRLLFDDEEMRDVFGRSKDDKMFFRGFEEGTFYDTKTKTNKTFSFIVFASQSIIENID